MKTIEEYKAMRFPVLFLKHIDGALKNGFVQIWY